MTETDTQTTRHRTAETDDVDRFQIGFDPQQDPVTQTLIRAVASLTDCPPDELPILNNYIDPDALNALFQPTSEETNTASDSTLFFRYAGYGVRIDTTGVMTLSAHSRT